MIKEFIEKVNFYEQAKFLFLNKKESPIPTEYKILPYVRSNGSQYVKTLYQFNSGTSDFYVDLSYEYTDIPDTEVDIFGNWSDDGSKCHFTYGIENNTQRIVMYYNGGFPNLQDGQPQINTLYNVSLNNIRYTYPHTMAINDIVYESFSNWGFLGNEEFYIFVNGVVKRFYSSIKLYSLTFYEIIDNVKNPVCNFIPAKRKSDNKIGLYDDVRNLFFVSETNSDLLYP